MSAGGTAAPCEPRGVVYRTAAKIMTDPMSTRINVLAIPGIKEPLVTDYASELTRDYSQAIYLMDIPSYV